MYFLFSQSLRKPSGLAPCFAQPALALVWASGSVNRPSCVSLRTSGSQRLPSHKQIQHKRLCLSSDSASRHASATAPACVLLRRPRSFRIASSPRPAGEPSPSGLSPRRKFFNEISQSLLRNSFEMIFENPNKISSAMSFRASSGACRNDGESHFFVKFV